MRLIKRIKSYCVMDELEKTEATEKTARDEIFSKAVRAGKRTYFFDVKSTRRNDFYLTITESKKRFNKDGRYYFEKHKIFLYKEDFKNFNEGLEEVMNYIKSTQPETIEKKADKKEEEFVSVEAEGELTTSDALTENFTQVDFDDLKE